MLSALEPTGVRGSDELRGENVPDAARRAACSRRNLVLGAHRYLVGTAEPPAFTRAGFRHPRAATAQRAILRARSELAGHSAYGNRRSSIGVGAQLLAAEPSLFPALESSFCCVGI